MIFESLIHSVGAILSLIVATVAVKSILLTSEFAGPLGALGVIVALEFVTFGVAVVYLKLRPHMDSQAN